MINFRYCCFSHISYALFFFFFWGGGGGGMLLVISVNIFRKDQRHRTLLFPNLQFSF